MLRIILLCNLGMSTSMLIEKMGDLAREKGIETEIDALPFDKINDVADKTDILLIGPQVRHVLPKIQQRYGNVIPVISTIDIRDYGLMNHEKILNEALALYDAKQNK